MPDPFPLLGVGGLGMRRTTQIPRNIHVHEHTTQKPSTACTQTTQTPGDTCAHTTQIPSDIHVHAHTIQTPSGISYNRKFLRRKIFMDFVGQNKAAK